MAVINIGKPSNSGVGDCKRAIDSAAIHRAIATKLILLTKAAMISGRVGILLKLSALLFLLADECFLALSDEYKVAAKVIARAATSEKT